jgi:hypothetical protein
VAAVRPAGDDHRIFGVEIDSRLGDRGFAADGLPRGFNVVRSPDPGLPLAVIAIAAGLEDDRKAKLCGCRHDLVQSRHPAPTGDARAGAFDEGLLLGAVLGDGQRAGAGLELAGNGFERSDREILELVGDDIHRVGEAAQRFHVIKVRPREASRDIGCTGPFVRVEDVAFVA